MQKLNSIKAVILDMDGVLVDSEPYHVESFKIMMDELNLEYDDTFIHSFIGHSIESNIQSINETYLQGKELNLEQGVRYRDSLYLDLIKQADLSPLSGIDELIETCQKNNIILALASSSVKEQVDLILTKLSRNGRDLYQIFSSIVTGDDVIHRKPAPDIYQKTTENLNTHPNNCLAVEDSPAGVESAIGAGLNCIALKSVFIPTVELENADFLVNDINQVVKLLQNSIISD